MSETSADRNCIFCKIVAGQIPSSRVFESDTLLGFEDIHPQAPFHCLVIPKAHFATLADFSGEQERLLGSMLLAAKQIAAERGLPGYRVAMNVGREGGQVVFHVHLHVLGGRALSGSLG
jgi:histidine triad (HIT) family protein